MAEVLGQLGSDHVIVVHGHDGMDEISGSGPTHVAELKDGQVSEYVIEPGQFGIQESPLSAIRVDGAAQSLAMICDVLADTPGPARDIVLLNAGAALCVAGVSDSIAAGVARAAESIASGAASAKLTALVKVSNSFD
jgi:anthranilate phosphoribosyltransferase